jgi:amino acid transporter
MEWLVFTSLLAMFIGFHNIVSRYIFAVARAGLLPMALSVSDPRSGSPKSAALFMGGVVLAVNLGFIGAGSDPMTVTFPWLSALGTVAIITGLIATSLSVIAYFGRTKADQRLWHTRIAPAIAAAGFAVAGVIAVLNYDTLLGGQGGIARWLLLLLPVGAAIGWIVADSRIRGGRHLDYAASLQ